MRTLDSLALTAALLVLLTAPVGAVVVDVGPDLERDDLESTVDLRARIEPMLASIELATDLIVEGDTSEMPWRAIREAAREGITTTLAAAVRECSKDYWAMTYSSFGLYYLATTRMLDTEDTERAYHELATAMETTNLTESAYARAVRDCERSMARTTEAGRTLAPPRLA